MKNGYYAPQLFAIGDAKTFILGAKIFCLDIDAILGVFYWHGSELFDLDEVDE